MRAYFQYSRRTHLKPAADPIRPLTHVGSAVPSGPSPSAFICLYLGQFPVRFHGFGPRTTYEIVERPNATLFGTEDEAANAASKHGCQPISIRPLCGVNSRS